MLHNTAEITRSRNEYVKAGKCSQCDIVTSPTDAE